MFYFLHCLGSQIVIIASKSYNSHIMRQRLQAIQSILIPGNQNTKKAAKKIQEKGFDVRPILHPTVEKGKERLRICLHSFNKKEDITLLCQLLNQI